MQLGNQLSLRVNRRLALLLVFFALNVLPISSQSTTSLDDIHIQPRVMQPVTDGMAAPFALPDVGPRPMKVNVSLVLVPVTIMDGMNRLVQGLDRNSVWSRDWTATASRS